MTAVLSTRSLNEVQTSRLKNAGISTESYDAISITLLDTPVPSGFNQYIFTSKNGVKGYLKNLKDNGHAKREITCFCVGEKTQAFLEKNGLFVLKMAQNAKELGDFLIKEGKKGPFLIFTGNRNRVELSEKLQKNNIEFREIGVYKTLFAPRKFEKEFKYILFFSPSGVQSFLELNSPQHTLALCIGETTAREAGRHFSRVVIADRQTTDAVIDKLIEIFSTPIKS